MQKIFTHFGYIQKIRNDFLKSLTGSLEFCKEWCNYSILKQTGKMLSEERFHIIKEYGAIDTAWNLYTIFLGYHCVESIQTSL